MNKAELFYSRTYSMDILDNIFEKIQMTFLTIQVTPRSAGVYVRNERHG